MNVFLSTLKNAFDAVPVCILILDDNLLINYANKYAIQLIDKPKECIIGKPFGEIFSCVNSYEKGCGYGAECIDCTLRNSLNNVIKNNLTIDNFEISIQHHIKGSKVNSWYNVGISSVISENRKNIILTISDITHKKNEEMAILQARDYSRNLLDSITAMIWKTDHSMNIEYVNRRWEEFTGISNEEIVGKSLHVIIHPEDQVEKYNEVIKSIRTKKPFEIEIRLLRKDGQYRSCLVDGTPCYNLDGSYDGYVGTMVDITEHKKVIESLNLYQKIAESSDEIILFIDMNGKITDANKAAVRTYGYTYEELCKLSINKINFNWNNIYDKIIQNRDTGKYFETVHYRKDGSPFDVEVYARITTLDNREIISCIARDITEKNWLN